MKPRLPANTGPDPGLRLQTAVGNVPASGSPRRVIPQRDSGPARRPRPANTAAWLIETGEDDAGPAVSATSVRNLVGATSQDTSAAIRELASETLPPAWDAGWFAEPDEMPFDTNETQRPGDQGIAPEGDPASSAGPGRETEATQNTPVRDDRPQPPASASRLRSVLPPAESSRPSDDPGQTAQATTEPSSTDSTASEASARPSVKVPAPASRRGTTPLSDRDATRIADGGTATLIEEPGSGLTMPLPVAGLVRLARAHIGVLSVLFVVALVFTGFRLFAAQGHEVEKPSPSIIPVTSASTPSASIPVVSSPATIRVHVLGAVVRPGVVELPANSRVADALAAAGGLREDADFGELNLAQQLPDGAQIIIGTIDEPRGELRPPTGVAAGTIPVPGVTSSLPGGGGSSATGSLDLNQASAGQLESLPGIGPVTAQRIIDWRAAHGGFTRVEELQEVDGIGPKLYARLAPLVHV